MSIQRFTATVPKHMERLLAEELVGLGAEDVAEIQGGAHFSGDLGTAYQACLWSRLANRVLMPLACFSAPTADLLYRGVQSISWAEHFTVNDSFAVDFNSSRSSITHTHFGALRVKDAVVDQFREGEGARPSVEIRNPHIRINLYLVRDEATLSLDLSGESLHRRGYRVQSMGAPLKENLAAAILVRAGWPQLARQGAPLLDPMCGSGTLPIEAALIAADIAPGLLRQQWGFLHWNKHDADIWRRLMSTARERRERGLGALPSIVGYDVNRQAVRVARENVARAGLSDRLIIEQRDLGRAQPMVEGIAGLLVTNPPYGERLGRDADLPAVYRQLGESLKRSFRGWRAAVFINNPKLGKCLGLRARKIHTLFNGAMECKLLHFEIDPEWFISERRFPTPLRADLRSEGGREFSNRLRKNMKNLGRWSRREGVSCYRLYDADLPEYALAIDIYQGDRRWVHVQEYQAPGSVDQRKARLRLREALGWILEILDIGEEQLFFKVRRKQKGGDQYEKMSADGRLFEVGEGGCSFLVNFEDYLDTGLFLDHRLTRRMLGELSAGKRFLNLFAYTGTASVYAAKGGALSTTTIDMSNTYLDWARRNMALNGCRGPEHRFYRADCVEWLKQFESEERYGVIFLDPPSFSASKRMMGTLDLQRDHVSLIRGASRLLEPDGTMIFSNNLRRFRIDREGLAGLEVENIDHQTLPKDFERNPRIHNCWRISRTRDQKRI